MSGFAVEITYFTDDGETNELHGPFRSDRAAERHADRIRKALPEDTGSDLRVYVGVRVLFTPKVDQVITEVERLIEELTEDDEDYHSYGQNSADHAVDFG